MWSLCQDINLNFLNGINVLHKIDLFIYITIIKTKNKINRRCRNCGFVGKLNLLRGCYVSAVGKVLESCWKPLFDLGHITVYAGFSMTFQCFFHSRNITAS